VESLRHPLLLRRVPLVVENFRAQEVQVILATLKLATAVIVLENAGENVDGHGGSLAQLSTRWASMGNREKAVHDFYRLAVFGLLDWMGIMEGPKEVRVF
jgi:hypothetical protein